MEAEIQGLTRFDNYVLPGIELLDQRDLHGLPATDPEELLKIQASIIDTLSQFGIEVAPGDISKGHAITRYEVYPADGVRMCKIVSLERDIARTTHAERINILAPIPGKDTVGIEIENTRKVNVTLRESMESEDFALSKAKIPLVLGKDVYGKTIIGDLAAMPHCLVAGNTGSGKSVCIKSMIASMLYKFTPEEIRFIMIDSKVAEIQVYNTLPHLMMPVVTDPDKALLALRRVIDEMEKRYKIFAKTGVHNITNYNARPMQKPQGESDAEKSPAAIPPAGDVIVPDKMPYIVIIVGNLADLIQTAVTDVENAIEQITEMGRAAGIHMIIATQTPRANAVKSIIKCNVPARIAFRCTARIESLEILGAVGAEKLSGAGDMLISWPDSTEPVHAQCAFTTDREIDRMVDFVSRQGGPIFERAIYDTMQSSAAPTEEELLRKCLEMLSPEKETSGDGAKSREIFPYPDAFLAAPSHSPSTESTPLPHLVVCLCEHCSQKIEFDANELGGRKSVVVPCPTCGVETNLINGS